MLNGDGLRVVLWVSGCNHCCEECQNPITWDPNGGIPFNQEAKNELFEELGKSYVSGITLSGGDPLHRQTVWISVHWCMRSEKNFQRKQSGCTPDICGNRSAILK